MTRLRQEPSVMRAALGVPAPVIETTGGNPPALGDSDDPDHLCALITKRGFRFVAIEGDWLDAARIDHYVRHQRMRPGMNPVDLLLAPGKAAA
jgi:hypothetical protein